MQCAQNNYFNAGKNNFKKGLNADKIDKNRKIYRKFCAFYQHHTVRTIRYKLYNIAGKTVTHAREIILKVNKQFEELFCSIRARAYQVSLQC